MYRSCYDATLRPFSVGEMVTVDARAATADTENVAHPETLLRTEKDALPTAHHMQAMAVYVPATPRYATPLRALAHSAGVPIMRASPVFPGRWAKT